MTSTLALHQPARPRAPKITTPSSMIFLGLNECTDMTQVVSLSEQHPAIEWAVYVSPSRQGFDPDYPRLSWIESTLETLPSTCRLALYFCDGAVQDLMDGIESMDRLITLLSKRSFGRVFFNFKLAQVSFSLDQLSQWMMDHPQLITTTPHHEANASLAYAFSPSRHAPHLNHQLAFQSLDSFLDPLEARDFPLSMPHYVTGFQSIPHDQWHRYQSLIKSSRILTQQPYWISIHVPRHQGGLHMESVKSFLSQSHDIH